MYDGLALHDMNNIVRVVLLCVAAGLWILYLHEVLFRSGKVKVHWVKRRLADLSLLLLMALVTVLMFALMTGVQFHHKH